MLYLTKFKIFAEMKPYVSKNNEPCIISQKYIIIYNDILIFHQCSNQALYKEKYLL